MAVRYLAAALGCIVFNAIYALFAHGVSSPFMTFMFAIPLLAGMLPALVASLMGIRSVPVAARQAWSLAIASLTVASCLHGIFDIAGTASPYLWVYVVVAILLAAYGVLRACRSGRRTKRLSR